MTRPHRLLLNALVVALFAAACSADGLVFRDSGTVEVTQPPDRSRVTLPVRISWEAADLAEGQRYAVFVDRSPQRPGTTIEEAFDPEDRGGIHVTAGRELLIEQLPIRGGVPERDRDRHQLTVVVLDGEGRRVGESYASIEVRVVRDAP